jgi:hypothetical protein
MLVDLGLSRRTLNAVTRSRLGADPVRLSKASIQEAVGLRQLGAKGLVELLVALEEAAARVGPPASDDSGDIPDTEVAPDSDGLIFLGGLTPGEADRLGAWCRGETDWLPATLNTKRLPPVPCDTHIDDLGLSTRTSGALARAGHSAVGAWLQDAAIGEILRVPGLGRAAFDELLGAIAQHTERYPPRPDLTEMANVVASYDITDKIPPPDPRLKGHATSFCQGGETIRSASRRIAARSRDPSGVDEFIVHLSAVGAILNELEKQTLEDELVDIAMSVSDSRKGAIFARYWGWDGRGGAVLQTVGDEFGLTRERVRQLCTQVETKVLTARPYAPVLIRCLNLASDMAPAWADEIQDALIRAGLSRGSFDIRVLIEAARLIGESFPLVVESIAGRQRVRKPEHTSDAHLNKTVALVRRASRRVVEHWGAGRIEDLYASVTQEAGAPVEGGFIEGVLTREPGFRWLDQATGWFWNADVPRNRLLNQIEKVLSVADAISVTELRTAVARNYRMEGQAPPHRVLAELCRQHGAYPVEGDVVRADPPLDPAEILAETELTFVQVLTSHASVMSRVALEEACRRRGMNKATFYVYLKNSPILTCPRRGVYALVGSLPSPGQLEAVAVHRSWSRSMVDSGWTRDGRIWVVHRISKGMLNSGVFSVPAGVRAMLLGDFPLRGEDGELAGTLRCREQAAWGLGPFLRRAAAQPGDYLAVVFDLAAREAVVSLGDQTLVSHLANARPVISPGRRLS